MPDQRTEYLWLEVTNVRGSKSDIEIQVKGDRAEREPVWWNVNKDAYAGDDAAKAYRTLSEGLDKKRIVLAGIGKAEDGTLECRQIRIQYAESAGR